MRKIKFTLAAALLALCVTARAQTTTNAPAATPVVTTNAAGQVIVSPSFLSTAEGYFLGFNTNLSSTFALSGVTTNKGQFWTGATLANNINIGQEIGASYYLKGPLSLEAQALNSGVFNSIQNAEAGLGYSVIVVDTRISLIADVGSRFSPKQVFGAGHLRLEKAATAHTFFGLDVEIQSGGKTGLVPMLTGLTGITFN